MQNVLTSTVYQEVGGADLGNDSLKLIIDPINPITVRNVVSRRDLNEVPMDLSFDSNSRSKVRDVTGMDVIIEPFGQAPARYWIGDKAVRGGENKVAAGTPKADHPYIHIPLLAMLALSTPEGYTEGRYSLVVGLPIKQFANKELGYRKRMKERLLGTYKVTLKNSKKDRIVNIVIENVLVVPEGVPVITNQSFNSDATGFRRQELQEGVRAVVDIGAGTTDIPVIDNGAPDSINSFGEEIGIGTYLDRIVEGLRASFKADITRNQLVERLEKGDYNMMIRGKQHDLKPAIDAGLTEFASLIVGWIDNIWTKRYDIIEFLIVGGGAKVLEKFIREQLKNKDFDLTFIYKQDKDDYQNDPQLQNGFGYWKIAKQHYKKVAS